MTLVELAPDVSKKTQASFKADAKLKH